MVKKRFCFGFCFPLNVNCPKLICNQHTFVEEGNPVVGQNCEKNKKTKESRATAHICQDVLIIVGALRYVLALTAEKKERTTLHIFRGCSDWWLRPVTDRDEKGEGNSNRAFVNAAVLTVPL